MATLIDLQKEIKEIFHELSPKERAKAMRNTNGVLARRIRRQAVNDVSSLVYELKPRGKRKFSRPEYRAKTFKDNIIAVPYRRAIGFHVTVSSRAARAGGHTKVDHLNRWYKWVPAPRWFNEGTEKQEARPFMDNAEKMLALAEKEYEAIFKSKIEKVAKKHNGT